MCSESYWGSHLCALSNLKKHAKAWTPTERQRFVEMIRFTHKYYCLAHTVGFKFTHFKQVVT